MNDPLETILAPPPAVPVPGWVFPPTLAALRRARRWQRARRLAALAAGVAALVALAGVIPQRRPEPAAEAPPPMAKAVAAEWRALEGQRPAAYVEAGDRYLGEGDPANAVRCYGHAVSAGVTDISESDSFLLMAIKLARTKESEACER